MYSTETHLHSLLPYHYLLKLFYDRICNFF